MMRTTFMAKPQQVEQKWLVIDATNKPLGRLATEVATLLRGKHKAEYTPHIDTGDFVIVLNAEKVHLTGNKWSDKMYYRHSGYVGGIKGTNAEEMREKRPERMIELAVKGMVPHNRLGRQQMRKLHVYAGNEHKHQAQKPETHEWKL